MVRLGLAGIADDEVRTERRLRLAPPDVLAATEEPFAVALTVDAPFYLNYAMTETNVDAAIRRGVPEGEIRLWCQSTLDPVFAGRPRDIIFQGFVAYVCKC